MRLSGAVFLFEFYSLLEIIFVRRCGLFSSDKFFQFAVDSMMEGVQLSTRDERCAHRTRRGLGEAPAQLADTLSLPM